MAKRGYHHGNLRQALVEAALILIEERGPMGFTLSEAAKRAGVTPAAVYRHFEGRTDLIVECALQGHRIFGDMMEHAYQNGGNSALQRFSETGRAYLTFARQCPGHYIAMFESGVSRHATPELERAVSRSGAALEKAAQELAAFIPQEKRPPAALFSSHVWAMSHGIVELFLRNSAGADGPGSPEELLETGIGIYLRGLGLIPPDQ